MVHDSGVEEDVALLKSVAAGLAAEYGLSGSAVADDLVGEMTRFGAGELHTVAAIMGGIAAQEAIKLLTAQFRAPQGVHSSTTLWPPHPLCFCPDALVEPHCS